MEFLLVFKSIIFMFPFSSIAIKSAVPAILVAGSNTTTCDISTVDLGIICDSSSFNLLYYWILGLIQIE